MTCTSPVPRLRWRLIMMAVLAIPALVIGRDLADPFRGHPPSVFPEIYYSWHHGLGLAIGYWLLLLIPAELAIHVTTATRFKRNSHHDDAVIHHMRSSLFFTRRLGVTGLFAIVSVAVYSLGQMCQTLLDRGGEPEPAMIAGGFIEPLTSVGIGLFGLTGLLLVAWCMEISFEPLLSSAARNKV